MWERERETGQDMGSDIASQYIKLKILDNKRWKWVLICNTTDRFNSCSQGKMEFYDDDDMCRNMAIEDILKCLSLMIITKGVTVLLNKSSKIIEIATLMTMKVWSKV